MKNQAKRVDIVTIKMIKESSILYPERKVGSPSDAASLIKPFLAESDREKFVAVYLNTKNEPTAIHTVSIGTLNASLVHPREVFKGAILSNASSLLLAHNHPSGDTKPSIEDRKITERLVEAAKILGLEIIDHIIVGEGDRFFSFKEQGML